MQELFMPQTNRIVHTGQRILNGLLQNDMTVVREIYEWFSGKVKAFQLSTTTSSTLIIESINVKRAFCLSQSTFS
jgi:hypothetical protein